MAAAPTLNSLLAPPDRATLQERLLLSLQGVGFPVTDWESGGVERTLVEMESDALFDLVANMVPTIVGGGFLDYSSGDWLTFLAAQLYDLERGPALFTLQRETLSSVAGTGATTLQPGELRFQGASGLFYLGPIVTDDDPGPTWTIPDGGSVTITIQSEHPNDSTAGLNYIDPAGQITTLVTQLAGVSCDNVAPVFSGVGQTGTGTGSVTPSKTSSPTVPDPHAFDIQIVKTGDRGIATFKWRMDGGEFSGEIETAPTFNLPGLTTIAFANGIVSPSFVAGDVYNFATPGTPTIQQGTDEESDESLRGRCRARWPSLSAIPVEDRYVTWAKQASREVTRVRISLDTVVGGQVNLILAGQAGAVSPAVVNAVSAYIIAREGIGFLSTVASAVGLPIEAGGTVFVPASKAPAVKTAAQEAWVTAVTNTDLGGIVELSSLIQILRNAGCSDINIPSMRLNGVFDNVTLTATQVATVDDSLANLLTWVEIRG